MKNIAKRTKHTLLFPLLFMTLQLFGQIYTFFELPNMPVRVSNNAVVGGMVNGVPHVFSFAGIDETKTYSGIHKRAFRYNIDTQIWDEIAELPSGNGRVAAAASLVKNKIYIIGGYEVLANGSEISVDKVHIYNPDTNSYEPDGTPIPLAIDDHVQTVWRDSLIYVVTGWSNTGNVPNVQIYNPSNDEWMTGTPVPNNNDYKAFGASGGIIEDTIYYLGGAKYGTNFPISNQLRKGVIDPDDPTHITWSLISDIQDFGKLYRATTFRRGDELYWLGGSEVTYNYDGIAYNGSGGVSPRDYSWITLHDSEFIGITNDLYYAPRVMDLRGIATTQNSFGSPVGITAGGMTDVADVTNQVFLITFSIPVPPDPTQDLKFVSFQISPNPISDFFIIEKKGAFDIEIWDTTGKLFLQKKANGFEKINTSSLHSGVYFLKIFENGKWVGREKLIIK
ncbi:MAG TPA: T9SS C-terminal target domain-containing protein [Phaeodactylibacter sp.]|nr:T9SS C-terminal target domain-containing protein [Phaeodactylibacter sp.]